MGLFSKKKNVTVEEPPKECSLIILCEEIKTGVVDYFADNGIYIKSMFTSISDTTFEVMKAEGNCRIVIIESGTGKFITQDARHELCDLLGVGSSSAKASVFYSNSVLKNTLRSEAKNIKFIDVDYTPYTSILTVLNKLSEYNEVYHDKGNIDSDDVQNVDFDYIGKNVDVAENNFREDFQDEGLLGVQEENDESSVQRFMSKF